MQAGGVAHTPGVAAHRAGAAACSAAVRQVRRGRGGRAGAVVGSARRGRASPARVAEDRGFQQGVGGQAVGAVHAGGGAFAGGAEAGQRGASLGVGRRRRPCGSARPARPGLAGGAGRARRPWQAAKTAGNSSGKPRRPPRARRERRRGPARRSARRRGRRRRAARVRRRDGSAAMNGCPVASTSIAPSPRRASVASGAGSRADVHGGGVELDELGVGDARAGQRRQAPGPRRARRAGWWSRRRGRRGRRWPGSWPAATISIRAPSRSTSAPRTRPASCAAAGAGRAPSRTSMSAGPARGATTAAMIARAGAVAADAGDAGAAVGGLQALHEVAVRVAVERRAERRQAAHRGRALAGEEPTAIRIDQAGAGRDGVGGVQLGASSSAQRRGHAALRPGRRAAARAARRPAPAPGAARRPARRKGPPGRRRRSGRRRNGCGRSCSGLVQRLQPGAMVVRRDTEEVWAAAGLGRAPGRDRARPRAHPGAGPRDAGEDPPARRTAAVRCGPAWSPRTRSSRNCSRRRATCAPAARRRPPSA